MREYMQVLCSFAVYAMGKPCYRVSLELFYPFSLSKRPGFGMIGMMFWLF